MTEVSVTESMRLTGKSRPTLYRHIKSGKLSKNPNGTIDTSELRRVYGEFVTNDNEVVTESSQNVTNNITQNEKDETEIQHLKEQLEMLKSQLSKTETQLERSQQKEDKLLQLIENRLPPPDEDSVVSRLKKKFL